MKLKPFLQIFGIIAIVLTLIPFVASDFWWIRIFDFPHIQLTILTMVALIVYFARFDVKWVEDYIFVLILGACFAFQLSKIYPYIPHNNFEIGDATIENDNKKIKFYLANVLQDNTNPFLLNNEIAKRDADLVLLMETNTRWMNDVAPAVKDYPYKIEVPLDNTYGMLLYSKLPFKNQEVRYLVDDSIPSISTILQLPGGDEVQLYCLHPTPPMPQHNPSSSDRDAEMMIIARDSRENSLPVLVAGDFNDVAWSQSTELFLQLSGLLDPRIGRGFYNTFNAKSHLMRWPLDHFFASEEFRLETIQLGDDIDSDHFPAYFEILLQPEIAEEQRKDPPTKKQLETASETIQKAREQQAEKAQEEQAEKAG